MKKLSLMIILMFQSLYKKVTGWYLDLLLSTAKGRALVFHQLVDSEDTGDSKFFARMLNFVDDGEIADMIKQHEADERKHVKMLLKCLEAQEVYLEIPPKELSVINEIDNIFEGIFERECFDNESMMNAYLLLQVIEERVINLFSEFQPLLEKYDPKSAHVIAKIIEEEKEHLAYCHHISRYYAPSEELRIHRLKKYRKLEGRILVKMNAVYIRYTLKNGFVKLGFFTRLTLKFAAFLMEKLPIVSKTSFW